MAQEQAKSEAAAAEATDQAHKPFEALTRKDDKPGEGLERGQELPKRTSLAERLKAEQRKREALAEPKRDETPAAKPSPSKGPMAKAPEETAKPPREFIEAPKEAASTPPKQFIRTKRPAGPPPQRRLGAPAIVPVRTMPTTPPAGPERIESLPWKSAASISPPLDCMN